MEEELLTVKDVANLTGISEYTIRKKLREGELNGKRTSDREGYRVSRYELIDYLKKAKKPIPAGLAVGAGLGLVAGGSMGLLGSLLPMAPVLALGTAVAGNITSMLSNDTETLQGKKGNIKERLNLSIGSLRDQIEAIQYSIQALELKEDGLSVEDKQKILTGKAQIKLLERQIKELKLKYWINQE